MSLLQSHFVLMVLYSAGTSVFFSFLLKPDLRSGVRFGALLLAVMVGGAILLAWLMYPFPSPLSPAAG